MLGGGSPYNRHQTAQSMNGFDARWFAFALALCGCAAYPCPGWHRVPLSISLWNPPESQMISCPWKPHETIVDGLKLKGKACDWKKIRCNVNYIDCVQTYIRIREDHDVYVACLPHEKRPLHGHFKEPPLVSRRRRSMRMRHQFRHGRRKLHPIPEEQEY